MQCLGRFLDIIIQDQQFSCSLELQLVISQPQPIHMHAVISGQFSPFIAKAIQSLGGGLQKCWSWFVGCWNLIVKRCG